MLIYDLLKPFIAKVAFDSDPRNARPAIYRKNDQIVYCNMDDGEIIAEQDLLTGNGTYEDGQNDDSWTSEKTHQILSLHQLPEKDSYLMAVTSFPSKEIAQKRYREDFKDVVFAGYVSAAEDIEVIANFLPDITTPVSVTGWEHFVNQLLDNHSSLYIGVSSDIPNDSGLED